MAGRPHGHVKQCPVVRDDVDASPNRFDTPASMLGCSAATRMQLDVHRRGVATFFALTVLVSCNIASDSAVQSAPVSSTPAATLTASDASGLRRPLRTLPRNEPCHPSTGRDAAEVPGAYGFVAGAGGYVAFGSGVIHAALIPDDTRDHAVVMFGRLSEPSWLGGPAPWRLKKVLWLAELPFEGAVLIRLMPGSPSAAFGGYEKPTVPEKAFTIPGDPGGDGGGGYVYFSAPGCYGLQIDALGFTDMVVIEVR